MTDLELTKACAEAMGLNVAVQLDGWRFQNTQFEHSLYDPLHNDKQAMALVKKFAITIQAPFGDDKHWEADITEANGSNPYTGYGTDLNRAIVECCARAQVAKMQSQVKCQDVTTAK